MWGECEQAFRNGITQKKYWSYFKISCERYTNLTWQGKEREKLKLIENLLCIPPAL